MNIAMSLAFMVIGFISTILLSIPAVGYDAPNGTYNNGVYVKYTDVNNTRVKLSDIVKNDGNSTDSGINTLLEKYAQHQQYPDMNMSNQ